MTDSSATISAATWQLTPEFVEQITPQLIGFFRNRLSRNDDHHADDLTQETWAKAVAALDRFDGRQPRAWVFQIGRNLLLDFFRKSGRQSHLGDHEITDTSSHDFLRVDEESEELKRCFDGLSDDQKSVVSLWTQGLPHEEIATKLSIQPGTVGSRFNRAKSSLKECLTRSRA